MSGRIGTKPFGPTAENPETPTQGSKPGTITAADIPAPLEAFSPSSRTFWSSSANGRGCGSPPTETVGEPAPPGYEDGLVIWQPTIRTVTIQTMRVRVFMTRSCTCHFLLAVNDWPYSVTIRPVTWLVSSKVNSTSKISIPTIMKKRVLDDGSSSAAASPGC